VELRAASDGDLAQHEYPTTRGGVSAGIMSVNGVKSVTDLAVVSFETLEELLLPIDPEVVRGWRREKARRLREGRHQEA
jgi:hypothetical protein